MLPLSDARCGGHRLLCVLLPLLSSLSLVGGGAAFSPPQGRRGIVWTIERRSAGRQVRGWERAAESSSYRRAAAAKQRRGSVHRDGAATTLTAFAAPLASEENHNRVAPPDVIEERGSAIADPNEAPRDLLRRVDDLLSRSGADAERDDVLGRVDAEHAVDCVACSALTSDSVGHRRGAAPVFEWIAPQSSDCDSEGGLHVGDDNAGSRRARPNYRPIALRTVGPTPLLSDTTVALLVRGAEALWKERAAKNETTSRFTYQRKGNYEAHLAELAEADPRLQSVVNEALVDRIYPLARAVLGQHDRWNEEVDRLSIYDSLFIRYNATEAALDVLDTDPSFVGAGQPLHRDGSLVSVNVMLNSPDEFEGGGTFFENQLLEWDGVQVARGTTRPEPLKPVGPGHALAHFSHERHAGAGTTGGVRDILVLFITGAREQGGEEPPQQRRHNGQLSYLESLGGSSGIAAVDATVPAPSLERAARLKSAARAYCSGRDDEGGGILCRALHHRLAVDSVPTDGEAWQYLGMVLGDYHTYLLSEAGGKDNCDPALPLDMLELSIGCLRRAMSLTPCDARLYNNAGLALEKHAQLVAHRDPDRSATSAELCLRSYERALQLHALSERAGCDVASEYDAATLNYGLRIANLDRFAEAAAALSRITQRRTDVEMEDLTHRRIVADALSLLRFCERKA